MYTNALITYCNANMSLYGYKTTFFTLKSEVEAPALVTGPEAERLGSTLSFMLAVSLHGRERKR